MTFRTTTANLLVRLAARIHPHYKYEPVPKDKFDTIERMKLLLDRVNGTMYQIPRRYILWIDWDRRPARILLCERSEPNVVHPERFQRAKESE